MEGSWIGIISEISAENLFHISTGNHRKSQVACKEWQPRLISMGNYRLGKKMQMKLNSMGKRGKPGAHFNRFTIPEKIRSSTGKRVGFISTGNFKFRSAKLDIFISNTYLSMGNKSAQEFVFQWEISS